MKTEAIAIPIEEFERMKEELSQPRSGIIEYRNQLTIGRFTIRPFMDGFFIEHESGAGMGCKADDLEALITQFYAENF